VSVELERPCPAGSGRAPADRLALASAPAARDPRWPARIPALALVPEHVSRGATAGGHGQGRAAASCLVGTGCAGGPGPGLSAGCIAAAIAGTADRSAGLRTTMRRHRGCAGFAERELFATRARSACAGTPRPADPGGFEVAGAAIDSYRRSGP